MKKILLAVAAAIVFGVSCHMSVGRQVAPADLVASPERYIGSAIQFEAAEGTWTIRDGQFRFGQSVPGMPALITGDLASGTTPSTTGRALVMGQVAGRVSDGRDRGQGITHGVHLVDCRVLRVIP